MHTTHRFFDAAISLPETWTNQTTVMFVSPKMKIAKEDAAVDQAASDDGKGDLVTQASMACRVVPLHGLQGEPSAQAKALLLQEMSGLAMQLKDMVIETQPTSLKTDDDRALYFSTASGKMHLPVRQLIGVLVQRGRGLVMVGTCTQAAFEAVQDELLQMLHSARIAV